MIGTRRSHRAWSLLLLAVAAIVTTNIVAADDVEKKPASPSKTVAVTGRVLTADTKTPVPDWTFAFQKQTVVTDKEGRFSARLIPGEATLYSGQVVRVGKPPQQYCGLRWRKFAIPDADKHELPNVELAQYITRGGHLIDTAGKPVAGWNVQASSKLAATDFSLGETDPTGRFDGHYPADCPPDKFDVNRPIDIGGGRTSTKWGKVEVVSREPLILEFRGELP